MAMSISGCNSLFDTPHWTVTRDRRTAELQTGLPLKGTRMQLFKDHLETT